MVGIEIDLTLLSEVIRCQMNKDFEDVFLVFHVVKSCDWVAHELSNMHLYEVDKEAEHLFFIDMRLAYGVFYLRDDAHKLRGLSFAERLIYIGVQQIKRNGIAQVVVVFDDVVVEIRLYEEEIGTKLATASDEFNVLHGGSSQDAMLLQEYGFVVNGHFCMPVYEQENGVEMDQIELIEERSDVVFVDMRYGHNCSKGCGYIVSLDKFGQIMQQFAFHRRRF